MNQSGRRCLVGVVVLGAVCCLRGGGLARAADATVTINPAIQYQTILGWGANAGSPPWPSSALREEIIREAVNDLGLTRLRLEPPSGNRSNRRRWEWLNDNGDPNDINWAGFETSGLDRTVSQIVIPFKQQVEANGEPFNIYVSPSFFDGGSSGSVPAWLLYSPGEYAEYATALLLYLKNTYGIEADYYCICNEAGNDNPFTAAVVARMIKTLGPRLGALGLPTTIEFPECISAKASWNYIQAVQDDEQMWLYVGVVTYHLYGSNSARPDIRDFAWSKALPTGQTEYMGLTMEHLYDDLTLGGVSYWEIYGLGSCFEWNYSRLARKGQYWNFRQVLHYVRPGAVRIEATSDEAAVRALGFVHNGKTTVILINASGSRSVEVDNLSPGTYGLCQSVGGGVYQELGLQSVGADGRLMVNMPGNTVLTIYPYAGTNQAPVLTGWQASPEYLTMPASSATLTASATDPELDAVSYHWSVTSQPAGASVVLATPDAASTSATGLSVAGDYVFTVVASDGRGGVATRQVRLTVFAENQPPVLWDVHNRLPVMITLPSSGTSLRGAAWDLEGDPLTYQWSVVSQPAGANVSLTSATTTNCTASNMTVPGDYVFRFQVSDAAHDVWEDLRVTVYPANNPPVISGASASPAELRLPTSSTELSAATSDPDGDVITHWWSIKSAPDAAEPALASQGSANTTVTGLSWPGTYVFTLTVIDQTALASQDVAVTVAPPLPGDFDVDGDVDLDDYVILYGNFTGPVSAPAVYYEYDGLLVMEAEHYDVKTAGSGSSDDVWSLQTAGGSVGDGYMVSGPNNGTAVNAPLIESDAPLLSYQVSFESTGTYYLWLRGLADSGADDSVHYGLDGVSVSGDFSSAAVVPRVGAFAWRSSRGDGGRPTVQIDSAGLHSVDIWMREDGSRIDRILLTTDEALAPAGDGPDETGRVPRVAGDLDSDGDVDLADFETFAANFTGSLPQ